MNGKFFINGEEIQGGFSQRGFGNITMIFGDLQKHLKMLHG